jgi:hypothetical protein
LKAIQSGQYKRAGATEDKELFMEIQVRCVARAARPALRVPRRLTARTARAAQNQNKIRVLRKGGPAKKVKKKKAKVRRGASPHPQRRRSSAVAASAEL